MEGISVVICTYNGASRIKQTLNHLARQVTPAEIKWEIIIIDNASTDGTVEAAEQSWKELSINIAFSTYHEPRPGLSFARDKGIQEAKFKYVIFCDDDNWLEKDYLTKAYNIISTNDQIGALGGKSIGISDLPLPDWFNKKCSNYAVGEQGKASGNVTERTFLWGSGMVINKLLYKRAFKDFPSILTGRKGKTLNSGEDSEMCMRFIIMGYQLYYDEKLNFKHFIGAEKLTSSYNSRLEEGFVVAFDTLEIYRRFIILKDLPFYRKASRIVKSLLKFALQPILRRWELDRDKLEVYLLTGIDIGKVSKEIRQIKLLAKIPRS